MRQRSAQVALAVVCFLLGVMLVVQFRTHSRIVRDTLSMPVNEQWLIASNLTTSNQGLRKEVAELRRQLEEYESSFGKSELDRMVADINHLRVVNGASEVSGPGIQMRIAGTLGPYGSLPPEELNDLVNELRNAGAEAIAVNGHRIVGSSAFSRTAGGTAINGDQLVGGPYVVEAIGQPEALERALNRPRGLSEFFKGKYPDSQITIYHKPELVLPKRDVEPSLQLARLVE